MKVVKFGNIPIGGYFQDSDDFGRKLFKKLTRNTCQTVETGRINTLSDDFLANTKWCIPVFVKVTVEFMGYE